MKRKMILKDTFFKLMNNAVFGKTLKNVRKNTDIKLVTTETERKYLVSESNYHTIQFFRENQLVIQMKKRKMLMSKPVYLRLSILELSKILMHESCCYYVKPKYGEKLYYMDTYIVYIKTNDIYKDIAEDVGTRFDTSKHEVIIAKEK